MRETLKRISGLPQVHRQLFALYTKVRRIGRDSVDLRTIEEYEASSEVRRLHIGCGHNLLPGWLNSDFFPTDPRIIHLDARRPFPLKNDSFDDVFSEHMIEHVTYEQGLFMLRECHRVLRSRGRIRVSTPNIKFLIELYSEEKSQTQKNYIRWASEKFIRSGVATDTMVINNFVRDWGHLFIYDEKTLRHSLELAGFEDVESFRVNESNDANLRNLENARRMPEGFLQLESFTLEAVKP